MAYLSIESFIMQRLEGGGCRVVYRQADLTDIPIADFVSYQDAEEWVNWKSGLPKTNPYADMEAPSRLVEIAIEPKAKADQVKLVGTLLELANKDPSLGFALDHGSSLIILKGTCELHLDAKLDDFRRVSDIEVRVGPPQVAFRETITRAAEVDYTHKKRSGGSGEFAMVKLSVEPGRGYQFESRAVGAVPTKFIPAIVTGVERALAAGVAAGFPVVDVKVTLLGGKYHDVDSSATAFETAARAAVREGLAKAGSVLLEPIMKVEVVTPESHADSVIKDFNLRRAQSIGRAVRGDTSVISAMVPLMNMFGYVNSLRLLSAGRATFTMQFDHYARPPDDDPPFRPALGMRA
jgi:elongation factor G